MRGRPVLDGAIGVSVGDADELVGNEVELVVDGADGTLGGFLDGPDAGALLGASGGGGGATHEEFKGGNLHHYAN